PVCDEFIIVHGDSDDDTGKLLESINSSKIKIFDTVWDPALREGGLILSQQTNIALSKTTGDWCFYIQADEVIHEKYLPEIKKAMEIYLDDKNVEGFLFKYRHFYGSFDYVAISRQWYRHEIRVIRNKIAVESFKDAQGFRINNRKLNVKPLDAHVFHYGWVRPPKTMQKKVKYFHSLWHSDKWIEKQVGQENEYDYSHMDSLEPFKETHPEVMLERVNNSAYKFDYTPVKIKKGFKRILLDLFEKKTGIRLGEYKNYKVI
ncbi:glycosyltransferase family 2 protein, partial [candidate division KSB1 bacterium]